METTKHREPARTLRALYNNLNPSDFLTPENSQFYVEIYSRQINEIRKQLLWDENEYQTIYVTGQSGSGKTTALNFLPDAELDGEFVIKRFDANRLLELNDVNLVDILLMLGFDLVNGNPRLEKVFLEKLLKISSIREGATFEQITEGKETQESGHGLKAGIGFQLLEFLKMGAEFFHNYRTSREQREVARKVLSIKKHELRDLLNDIIQRYLVENDPEDKKRGLLVIFNELDHIKNWNNIQELFQSNDREQVLEKLRCKKIISLPVILKTKYFRSKAYFLGLKLSGNPNSPGQSDGAEMKANRNSLLDIINRRIADDVALISEEAKAFAIDKSGGIIRQMMEILRYTLLRAADETSLISLEDVQNGAEAFRPQLRDSLTTPDRILLLDKIRSTNFFVSNDSGSDALLTELFLANQVILYENGDPWGDVNPLIQETVAKYAAKLIRNTEKNKNNS